ncbi:MAG: ribonuclease III [Owenweeksia sp.]|nr:ribonuclease III [Owenweeksia sp.]
MLSWFKNWSSPFQKDGDFFLEISKITGFKPKNEEYYKLALRHSSATRHNKGRSFNNQRLEFLGDAILGAVVTDYLYQEYPKATEGFLTNMRSKIVSRKHLNHIGLQMGLHKLVVKKTAKGIQPKSIYGDALEALIGAVYLDRGFAGCQKFVLEKLILAQLDLEIVEGKVASHKGALLEWGQKNKCEVNFEITGCYGQSHARKYEISLFIDGELLSTGKGSSKKKAEEDAARVAYKKFLKS